MIPQRYRRLLRRRLRRRPLLPFVLLAFFALDAVAFAAASGRATDETILSSLGLLGAQVGLLAAWVTSARRGWLVRLTVVVCLVGVVAAAAEGDRGDRILFPVVLLILALTVLGTLLARKLANALRDRKGTEFRKERVQIGRLLVATFLVAVLATALGNSSWRAVFAPITLMLSAIESTPTVILVFFDCLLTRKGSRWIALLLLPAALVAFSLWLAMQPRGGPAMIGTPQDFLPYYSGHSLLVGATLLAVSRSTTRVAAESSREAIESIKDSAAEKSIDLTA